MSNGLSPPQRKRTNRFTLKTYNVTLPMGSLAIGVDNIRHDVFLSPKFVQVSRDYLFDLIRQNASNRSCPASNSVAPNPSNPLAFAKCLADLLQKFPHHRQAS